MNPDVFLNSKSGNIREYDNEDHEGNEEDGFEDSDVVEEGAVEKF